MSQPYGSEHREQRTKKLESMDIPQCEITREKRNLEAHHVVPKSMNGPDLASNYQILSRAFHDYLHDVCANDDCKLVQKRLNLAHFIKKNLLHEERVQPAKEAIRALDEILMKEYIEKLVRSLGDHYADIVELTLYNNFSTIRDLTIERDTLRARLDAIELQKAQCKST